MEENDEQDSTVAEVFEQPERDDWISGQLPLNQEEYSHHHYANYEEADDGGGIPRKSGAAVLEAEEKEEGSSDHGESPHPIYGFDPIPQWSFGSVELKEEEDDEERNAVDWQIDVEAPSSLFSAWSSRKDTSERDTYHLQVTPVVKAPPTTGPSAEARAHTAPIMPRNVPLVLRENKSPMMVSTSVSNPPAAIP